MNLVVDIGNSFIKTAVFSEDKLITTEKARLNEMNNKIFNQYHQVFSAAIISSVIDHHPEIDHLVKSISKKFIHFDYRTPLPLKNSYKTPETLGKDRLAMAAGAAIFFQGENVLIIDAGTCTTFDIVTEQAEYLGGSIHPGLLMRFKSLNSFTAKLPLETFDEAYGKLIGNNTKESIQSGVQTGFLAEIQQMINWYKKEFSPLKIILTGGDSSYLLKYLKSPIIADEFFLLKSLNKILLFNA